MANRTQALFACLCKDQYLPDKLALILVISGLTTTLTGSGLLSQRKEHGEATSSSNSSLLQVNIGTVIFLIGGIWLAVIWMNRFERNVAVILSWLIWVSLHNKAWNNMLVPRTHLGDLSYLNAQNRLISSRLALDIPHSDARILMWNDENWAISLVSRGGSAERGTAQVGRAMAETTLWIPTSGGSVEGGKTQVERDKGERAQGVSAQFHIELEHKGSSSKPNNALDKYLTD
ncbi:hypothetical protein F5882DRAFT_489874 [Hyaloscypha sp. PMI_1271]|nr:hypothetical protein F5882DRAFT_489874 [Hyaloscypha sp. PMI_1271]